MTNVKTVRMTFVMLVGLFGKHKLNSGMILIQHVDIVTDAMQWRKNNENNDNN